MHWIALQALPDAAPDGSEPDPAPASPVSSALALADALTALGWWALQFTPHVAQVDQALVLEVSASERLFGGREPLLAAMLAAAQPVGPLRHAQAATSLLALALLQRGAPDSTRPDELPLATLAEAQAHLITLERIGCRCWGDLRALPRGGVVRRFGAPLLDALDRAYGLQPEVYPWLVLPEVFDMPLELAAQVEAAPALLFAARRLLGQLQVWLRARRLGILALELAWEMDARRNTATRGQLVLRTAEATLDMQHLQRLLAEQLAQVTLPAHYAAHAGRDVTLGLRPEHLHVATDDASATLQGPARVVEPLGSDTLVVFETAGCELQARLPPRVVRHPGDPVRVSIAPEAIHVFDPETALRL